MLNNTIMQKVSALINGAQKDAYGATPQAGRDKLTNRHSLSARVLSVALTVVLVTGLCPGIGLASGNAGEAADTVQTPQVVQSVEPDGVAPEADAQDQTDPQADEDEANGAVQKNDLADDPTFTTASRLAIAPDLSQVQVMSVPAAELSGIVSVATAEELYKAVAAPAVTGITLTADITIDQTLTVDRELTMTGSTLTRSDRTKSVFVVTSTGDLTLTNIALVDNGKDGTANNYASAIQTSGGLTLGSGAVISGFKAADGGAIYAVRGSSVAIDGAMLSSNMACATGHAAMGGAVYAESGSSIVMTSGLVDGNVACSANNPDNRNGGMGGGFCLARGASMTMDGGTISNNTAGYYTSDSWSAARNGAGGGVFVNAKAGFIMNNGTVSGNKALSGTSGINYYGGGGICIWNSGGYDFSGLAQINAGAITGNEATLVGGGLYVHNYRLLPMHNAAVVNNSATIHGGGLYLCMVGEVYNFATDGTIFTNNAAAGDKGDYAPGDDLWSDEPWGGSKANFHLPERTESGEPIAWYEDTRANPYTDASQPIEDFATWFEANKNNNTGLRCDAPYDAASYALIVSGNKAQEGGGIGCNGILEMCNPDDYDVPLTIKKVWADDNSTQGNTGEGSDDQGLLPVADLGDDQDGNGDQGENPDNPAGNNAVEHPDVTVNIFNGEVRIDTVVLNAENNWKATLTGLPSDGSYSVTEDDVDGYEASIEKTSENSWEFTITNTPEVKPVDFDVDFDKYLYALNTDQTFSFTMAECNQDGMVGEVVEATPDEENVISADEPFTVTVHNGEFDRYSQASIDFPTLRFMENGTHYYRVFEEQTITDDAMVMDESWFLLKVVVDVDADGNRYAQLDSSVLHYDGEAYEVDGDELYFCNNEMMTLSCTAMEYAAFPDQDQRAEVNPLVKKELENRVLSGGEFTFKMVETTPGVRDGLEVEATNDAAGLVSFGLLSYSNTGTYTYDITEVAGSDPTVVYDSSKTTLTVEVMLDQNGALRATASYECNGKPVDGATFVNKARTPVLRVQKTSKDGSQDPLQGAWYGLWMVNQYGSDVYLGSQCSDQDGFITFDDVDLQVGGEYYFKEESAPEGHTVDEYRSDTFTVVLDQQGYRLASADSAQGAETMSLESAAEPMTLAADADEPVVLTYAQGVQDEVTKLSVTKYDAGTHEVVEGATMQIIEERTGILIKEWVTGKEATDIERVLNVGTPYILREAKAPNGYACAEDTHFAINEYGDVTISQGTAAEVAGKFNVGVYDVRLAVQQNVTEEDVVKQDDRYVTTSGSAKTGDYIPFFAAGGLIAVIAISLALTIASRRREKDHKE